jgi:hypothetical protein
LLETLKERLKETSIDPSVFDRLALLSDSDAYFPSIASDSESEGVRSKTPMGANGKRKQTQAGYALFLLPYILFVLLLLRNRRASP